MTDSTDEDVERAAAAAWSSEGVAIHGAAPWDRQTEPRREAYRIGIRAGLAAVLPAYRARVRAEALREAVDALDQSEWYTVDQAVEFLRGYARADAEGAPNE
jgi:hypothetical protein